MERSKKPKISISSQVKAHKDGGEKQPADLTFDRVISSGSTLLDLSISGGRVRGGGLPGGILVEIFGPSGCGKTVLLCEIAGGVQRAGGEIMFCDPEARLDEQFAKLFDLDVLTAEYSQPNTVPEVFEPILKWEPKGKGNLINGIFADSLAALSTDLEMGDGGDKMGMRRAKEFSEQTRKTARVLSQGNYLMVCSNQVRVNVDAGPYGQKYTTSGGEAVGFYASVRLRCASPQKIKKKVSIKGKIHERVIGVETLVEVYKNSVDKPYRSCVVPIIFDYGIDDIRGNLKYVKEMTGGTVYAVNDTKLDKSLEASILQVEEEELIAELKEQVIDLWEECEKKFASDRAEKVRA